MDSVESAHNADESSDIEMKTMKDQLTEFGLEDENLSKEEMIDLLKALNNSKSTAKRDEMLCQKQVENLTNDFTIQKPPTVLKRRYKDVRERRLPWSILPSDLTHAEKARALAVYIKLMSINRYWQARNSTVFAAWPPPVEIAEETSSRSLRSTRSGRNVPIYCGEMDDDSSDIDFVITKPKKRKISGSESTECVYFNKSVSLKRKPLKEEQRPMKEIRINNNSNRIEAINSNALSVKAKKDLLQIEH